MKYQAVVFDLDGTLLDTLEDLADSMNAALARKGLPTHPVEAYKKFVGDGMDNLVYRTAPPSRDDAKLHAELLRDARDEYSRRWADKTRPYEGVGRMLDEIGKRGLKRAVLSNKPHEFTVLCVEKLLQRWSFDAVRGVGDGVPEKPDTTGVMRICDQLGVSSSQCLYLGDTDTDMQTANAAGMYAVGALWGFRDADELKAHGAKALIEHPVDLTRLLVD